MARTANSKTETVTEAVVEETPVKETVTPKKEKSVQSVELRRRQLAQKYKNEEKLKVSIPPLYKPYFGNTMSVGINGITVYIPCDGKTYKVPKTHAIEAMSRIKKIDLMLTRKDRMRDIQNNVETSPGELKFY